jgi:hypothetical protein
MKRQKLRWRFSRRTRKIILLSGSIFVGLFIAANAASWVVYRNRTYPQTKVMHSSIGNVSYGELSGRLSKLKLLPDSLEFVHGRQKVSVSLTDLGITTDAGRTTQSAGQQRFWLPVVNFFKTPELRAPVAVDSQKFNAAADNIAKILHQEPVSAHLAVSDGTVSITDAEAGFELNHASLKPAVLGALDTAKTSVDAPVTAINPKVQAAGLQNQKSDLEAQFKTAITYKYNGQSKQAAAADIAGWYVPSGETYVLSPEKVQAYIVSIGASFGIRVKDIAGAGAATQQALAKKQALDLTLTQQVALKTFTYCVAAKGVDAANLTGLRSKLNETYGSSRGWSVGGLVEFKEVPSGCNFTVWLTAASLMPTFGSICDSLWSCRVGPNVVVNFDRWQTASPAWNQLGGSLDEYRHMVINHETGHWLSFGHSQCPGAGQPAPVMQQQSIDLQGCNFNAWPTAGEIAVLRTRLGI